MKPFQITTSAALFCRTDGREAVPLAWYERAVELFHEHDLAPILFTAGGGPFELDDCYVLADRGNDLFMFGEPIRSRRAELIDALRQGSIDHLGVDSPRAGAKDRENWRATVSASRDEIYVGVDAELVFDPADLLRWTFDIAKDLFEVRYGIAYKMPLEQLPDCYVSGTGRTSFAEVLEMLRHRERWEARIKTPDELWEEELMQQRRHLTGLFRAAYPANILSDAHVQGTGLNSQSIGQLSKLDDSLWLWQLSESEIPKAQALLESRRVLVSQAAAT